MKKDRVQLITRKMVAMKWIGTRGTLVETTGTLRRMEMSRNIRSLFYKTIQHKTLRMSILDAPKL